MNTPEAAQSSSLSILLKRKAAWEGISLAHYRCRPGEQPERSVREHLVVISLGAECRFELSTASGFRARGTEARGGVCVLPSMRPFSARIEGEVEHLALYLDPSLIWRAATDARLPGRIEVVEKCAPSDTIISSVGLALLAEVESEGLGGRLYAESLANVLAVHLLRHYTAAGSSAARSFGGGLPGHKLRRVLAFIAENYERDLSLAELAGVAGMSTFHFAREFKRSTGTTPHQHLMKFRIERAKALLAESEMPLAEVGFRSGFSHQSHLTRIFRKLTGTTPQSYRLMFQS